MNYIRVGKSGLKLTEITFGSALTIGTEFNDKNRIQELIDTAWDLGIRSFDTSNNYGNAEILLEKRLIIKDYQENIFYGLLKNH